MSFKQDMPPEGGFKMLSFDRVPPRGGWNPKLKALMVLTMCGIGTKILYDTRKKFNLERIEVHCARVALMPMVHAEVDRMLLKQLKRNRDAEEEVMKNVKGWEVGKYKGSPVYFTLGPDDYVKPSLYEYTAHTKESERFEPFYYPKIF